MANEGKGRLPDHFDQERIAPRPHEHAWFLQCTAAEEVGQLLKEGQDTLAWDKIVSLADNSTDHRVGWPLKVECACCGIERNFDFIYGSFARMKHEQQVERKKGHASRESEYLGSPAIGYFNGTVVQEALDIIMERRASHQRGKLRNVKWHQCTNCEASAAMCAARALQPKEARDAAQSLGLGPDKPKVGAPRGLGCAVAINGTELASLLTGLQQSDELDMPEQLRIGVLLVDRERLAEILNAKKAGYKKLTGVPDTDDLFASGTSIGRVAETRAAAGGDDVNAAAVAVAPKKLIDKLLQQPCKSKREAAFWKLMRTQQNGFEGVGFGLLNMELPDADAIAAEQRQFFSRRVERSRGHDADQRDSKSEVRVGRISSWAVLLRNPDFADYARMLSVAGGLEHVKHMLMVVRPNGDLSRALLIYPSGPRGRASKLLKPTAQLHDGALTSSSKGAGASAPKRQRRKTAGEEDRARSRLCYGQPRTVVIVPGRPFFDASLVENRDLQKQDGPFAQRARKLAHCGLVSMLALAFMGLAPRPGEDKDEWLRKRKPLILGDGIAYTAEYTWTCLGLHSTPRLAIHALACTQGFYENFYGATLPHRTQPTQPGRAKAQLSSCRAQPPRSTSTEIATGRRGLCSGAKRPLNARVARRPAQRTCRSCESTLTVTRTARSGRRAFRCCCTPPSCGAAPPRRDPRVGSRTAASAKASTSRRAAARLTPA